jgi:hypothetical protein
VCPEERDAEEEATGQVCVASQLDHGLQRPDVTLDGSAAGVDCDHVVDVTGIGVGDLGQHPGGGVDAAHDKQVTGRQQHVPDESEDSELW